jgi:hypothetical protein
VNIFYGGSAGIDGTGNSQFFQGQAAGTTEQGDGFGTVLSAGDYNGGGTSDLSIGTPNESAGIVPLAGAVNIMFGAAGGIDAVGNSQFTQDSTGKDPTEQGDLFGSALR